MIMRKVYYILLCCVWLGQVACQDKGTEVGGQGRIRLSITDRVISKALPDALSPELTDRFQVEMIRLEDNRLVFGGTCADFNARSQLFRSGEHTIQVSYGDNPLLAMDAPYYVSEKETVIVESGTEQEVVLQCRVGNAVASFEFLNADKLDKMLKNYYIELVVGGETLKWNPGSSEHPYIKAGSEVEFYLKGTWIENGLPYARKFANVMPVEVGKRYHYKLKFDTSNLTGIILDIEVEAAVETITVNETLPQEWLPKPKITAEGFDENNLLTYTETEEAKTAVISYAAVRPVQDVEITLNFADPNLSALNKTYLLSTITEEDRQALQNAAIVLPTLDQVATMGKIDFTEMTSSLLTKDGGLDADNQFQVRIKANERWSDKADYTVKTIKPVFSIGVYPGNIWTKEFTANPLVADSVKTGDFTKFSDITYEFSTDGTNWTTLAADLRKDELTPGSTYYVRPKYRGQVPGKVTSFRTYEAMAIPNSNLDEGYETSYPKSGNPLYTFNGGWIGTRNPLTCHSNGVNAFYVSKSSTLPITDNGSTGAHMMTIGWGQGNSCSFGNKSGSVIKNISSGIVCVGEYDSGQDSIYAKSAYVRPTSMTFVYKASPYGDDEYLISIQLINITDGLETVIGRAEIKSNNTQSDYITQNLDVVYNEQFVQLPISHVRLIFKAGTKEDRDHLEDKFSKEGSGPFYSNYYLKGSQFWLDSFVLNYNK